jgi:hypothetical protein
MSNDSTKIENRRLDSILLRALGLSSSKQQRFKHLLESCIAESEDEDETLFLSSLLTSLCETTSQDPENAASPAASDDRLH